MRPPLPRNSCCKTARWKKDVPFSFTCTARSLWAMSGATPMLVTNRTDQQSRGLDRSSAPFEKRELARDSFRRRTRRALIERVKTTALSAGAPPDPNLDRAGDRRDD